jgi:hypothetical protein
MTQILIQPKALDIRAFQRFRGKIEVLKFLDFLVELAEYSKNAPAGAFGCILT